MTPEPFVDRKLNIYLIVYRMAGKSCRYTIERWLRKYRSIPEHTIMLSFVADKTPIVRVKWIIDLNDRFYRNKLNYDQLQYSRNGVRHIGPTLFQIQIVNSMYLTCVYFGNLVTELVSRFPGIWILIVKSRKYSGNWMTVDCIDDLFSWRRAGPGPFLLSPANFPISFFQ